MICHEASPVRDAIVLYIRVIVHLKISEQHITSEVMNRRAANTNQKK